MNWQQHTLHTRDPHGLRLLLRDRITPVLVEAEEAGELSGWWFMNKDPMPIRYLAPGPSPTLDRLLEQLQCEGHLTGWNRGIYEPETHAFGGEEAMTTVHRLFAADSHHLLTHTPQNGELGPRERSAVATTALLRGARLDWFEQGDVWATLTQLRPNPAELPPDRATAQRTAVRTLFTADPAWLLAGPMRGHDTWISAFWHCGATLGQLARAGRLDRGLRAVLAHVLIFHFNRAGLSTVDQATLAQLAKDIIMTTSDTSTLQAEEQEADKLRNALVDTLLTQRPAMPGPVEDAMRAVPRHLFLPGEPLERAYANDSVHIKYAADGTTSLSCASQPGIVALMAQQLDVHPGDRVLELGAGTGYNAAVLAHLTGPTGHVTTIDVDQDLVDGARGNLAAAGVGNVTVLLRDGALGAAETAPFDRIIASVGAHGVPQAWMDQLAPGGRLVVPQRIRGSVSRSIAYERDAEGRWRSVGSEMNTFMPLRQGIADDPRRRVPLTRTGLVQLQTNSEQDIHPELLAEVLDQPRTQVWSGVCFRAMESPEWMELYLTCTVPGGLVWMPREAAAVGTVLTDDPYPSSSTVVDKGALAYLTRRPSTRTTETGGKLWEFGVAGHGPGGAELADKVSQLMTAWDEHHRDAHVRFELLPTGHPVQAAPDRFTVETAQNTLVIDWR